MLVGQIERRDLRAAPSGEEPNFQLILGCNPHYLNHLCLLLPGVLTGLTRSHETASYQQARWYSAVINCGNFVQTYHGASPQGRAALLEQATQGALDWVRARPRGQVDQMTPHLFTPVSSVDTSLPPFASRPPNATQSPSTRSSRPSSMMTKGRSLRYFPGEGRRGMRGRVCGW